MSIEKLIETNTAEVMNLTAAIRDLIATLGKQSIATPEQTQPDPEQKPKRAKKSADPEAPPVESQPVEPETPPAAILSLADLQAMCLNIVRGRPEMKERIKDLIGSFGGAKLLKDVPEENLPELAKLLREAE